MALWGLREMLRCLRKTLRCLRETLLRLHETMRVLRSDWDTLAEGARRRPVALLGLAERVRLSVRLWWLAHARLHPI